MYQENICEEAIREERTRIAGELDTLLQTFLSAGRGGGYPVCISGNLNLMGRH